MRVGVIGCGGMGLHHAVEVRELDLVDEVVCCDLAEGPRKQAEAKGFGTAASLDEQDGDFLRRVAAGEPPQFPASDALRSMEWVELAEESLRRGGNWVTAD